MNWNACFRDKLVEWVKLREHCDEPFNQYLEKINLWWHHNQWVPYELDWSDKEQWPTPWDLLNQTRFCTVARGLGILYTLAMSNCDQIKTAVMHDCGSSCPVIVNDFNILNLESNQIFHISEFNCVGNESIDIKWVFDKIS